MLSFRTHILVLVLASLSLASWRGGTTTTVTAQESTPGGNVDDSGFGVDTPTVAPVVAATSAIPSGNTPTGGEATATTPPVAVLGADYCTYSPDPTCYSNNGKPDCCLDDGIECPAEAAPCDVVGSETEAPTFGAATTTPPVAIVGADYCTFAPDPTCYSNSGKPDCCLDDAVDCPAEAAPCDVVDGSDTEAPSAPPTAQSTETSVIPTPSVLSSPAPTTGGEATTTTPPSVAVVDDASAPPTPQSTDTSLIPSPGPTQVLPLPGSDYCTYSPDPACYSNSGKPECCMNEFIDCPDDKPPCDVVGTEVPTKAPIVFPGFIKCSANDVCKEDGLEGNCCPNDDGTVLDCCYGITESPVAAGTDPSESPTSMTSGGTPTGGPIEDAEVPTTSVPTTEAAVPAVTITTPPPQPEEATPTQEQTPPAPEPNDTSESSSESNVDINISAAVVSGVRFVGVAVGVVTAAVVVAVF